MIFFDNFIQKFIQFMTKIKYILNGLLLFIALAGCEPEDEEDCGCARDFREATEYINKA